MGISFAAVRPGTMYRLMNCKSRWLPCRYPLPGGADNTERAEREAAVLRENETRERERAEAAERRLEEERLRAAAEATELRAAGEAARLQAARAEATAEGLRLALEEARRPFWRRWIG
jgi:flagellar biosynthesis/type III secretory pathway protein FliH